MRFLAKSRIRWYKVVGSSIGGLPSAGGVFPGSLCLTYAYDIPAATALRG